MKNNYSLINFRLLLFVLALAVCPFAHGQTVTLTGSGTAEDPYQISSKDDWNAFADIVNKDGTSASCAVLTADIQLGNDTYDHMIGTSAKPYSGIFDGKGHTLSVDYNTDQQNVAPFRYIDGATIKNLTTSGTFTVSKKIVAGIVACIVNKNNKSVINNCVSEVTINSTINGEGWLGGLVGLSDGKLEITDCVFRGFINGSKTTRSAGFIGWSRTNVTILNCLNIGSFVLSSNCYNFFRASNDDNVSISNSYYLKKVGIRTQGTQVSTEQLANGEVAWKLQNKRTEMVWGQTIGTDKNPLLTTETACRVWKVTISGKENKNVYANNGTKIGELIDELYPADLYLDREVAIEDGYTLESSIDNDIAASVTVKTLEIASKDDWNKFADYVNKDGKSLLDAVLTADVSLGNDIYDHMIGTNDKPYAGTFDGRGHKLSVDYNANQQNVAPFRYIAGATIKNLTTSGTFTVSNKYAAGIVARIFNKGKKNSLTNCISAVNIVASVNGDGTHGGLVANSDDNLVIEDCLFTGSIAGSKTTKCGGFVGWAEKTVSISNSLNIGNFNLGNGCSQFTRARNNKNVTISNSCFLNTVGTAQGTKVTAEQLKSGEVLAILQGGRTDAAHWGQDLGKDLIPSFYDAEKAATPNYVSFNAEKGGMYTTSYTLTDGGPGLDFATDEFKNYGNREFTGSQSGSNLYTICVPIAINTVSSDVKLYELNGISADGMTVEFRQATSLEAGKPYLLEVTGTETVDLFNGVSGNVSSAAPEKVSVSGVNFCGTYSTLGSDSLAKINGYTLLGKQWNKVEAEANSIIEPSMAYLTSDDATAANILNISLNDETTGIQQIQTISNDGTMKFYNLRGQYIGTSLDNAPRGVYIGSNGKKVLR